MCSGQRRKQLSRLARRSPTLNWLDLPDTFTSTLFNFDSSARYFYFYSFQLLQPDTFYLLLSSASTLPDTVDFYSFQLLPCQSARYFYFYSFQLLLYQIRLLLLFLTSALDSTVSSPIGTHHSSGYFLLPSILSTLFLPTSTLANLIGWTGWINNFYSGQTISTFPNFALPAHFLDLFKILCEI